MRCIFPASSKMNPEDLDQRAICFAPGACKEDVHASRPPLNGWEPSDSGSTRFLALESHPAWPHTNSLEFSDEAMRWHRP